MTNHWIDIKNSDCILIMGSNAAENHPVSFKYVTEAMDKGATLISVDPRFTRTSAKADIYAPLRSGSDIAFLGGMIKYILDNGLYSKEYVSLYTNASFIVGKKYGFKDGLFSGYEKTPKGPSLGKYDKSTWAFEMSKNGVPKMDRSLKHKRSVFQLLKKHFSRYDMKTVSAVTGTPEADLKRIYTEYSATGKRGQAGTIMYAMGWTQHTTGVQNIRTMAMIQLLLGNMGVAGGGVNALRGESNVQGSTDHCLLWHIWPGYLKTPRASNVSLAAYNGMDDGLTTWGRAVIDEMAKYGIILDLSHTGAQTAADAMAHMEENHPQVPFVFTHSLPAGLYKNEKHATDRGC